MKIEIILKETKPVVKRTVEIKSSMKFHDLHYVIQIAMGWENMHLYQFKVHEDLFIGELEVLTYKEVEDAREIEVCKYLKEKGDEIEYEYDFGDGWLHQIRVISKETDGVKNLYPKCIDGQMNCPPEDCGGIWGYEDLKEKMEKPKSKEAKEIIEWLGFYYDANEFDIDRINEELTRINEYKKNSFYEI